MMSVGEYIDAVARMHGLTYRAMARALKVTPAVLRRWRRGVVLPSWRRVQAMVGLWGGDAQVIFLGTALERFGRDTGLSKKDIRRLCLGKSRVLPRRRGRPRPLERDQLNLPIGPREQRA
jgi:transcriptional regulator with XRE-family HTH domain